MKRLSQALATAAIVMAAGLLTPGVIWTASASSNSDDIASRTDGIDVSSARRGGGGGGKAGAARANRGGSAKVNRSANVNRSTSVKRNTNVNVNRRTNVNVNRSTNVNVVRRPYRGWAPRPYYGTIVGGIALGSIIAATAVGVAPAAPGPNMCWFWSDQAMTNGYWDYCNAP